MVSGVSFFPFSPSLIFLYEECARTSDFWQITVTNSAFLELICVDKYLTFKKVHRLWSFSFYGTN